MHLRVAHTGNPSEKGGGSMAMTEKALWYFGTMILWSFMSCGTMLQMYDAFGVSIVTKVLAYANYLVVPYIITRAAAK